MCHGPKPARENRISVSGSVLLIKRLLHLGVHYSRRPLSVLLVCRFLRNATVKPYFIFSLQTLHLVRDFLLSDKSKDFYLH